jgi:ribosome-binding protein aMBF1 (putative translation factor)
LSIYLKHPAEKAGSGTVWVHQEEYETVGEALAHARDKAGLTQKQLARLLRKPQSFVSDFERGQRRIDILEQVRDR